MGRSPKDIILEWIDYIPDSKLVGTFSNRIYKDSEMRLDSYITGEPGSPQCFNLQVQINNKCKNWSLRRLAVYLVAIALMPCDEPWTPEKVMMELKKTHIGGHIFHHRYVRGISKNWGL
ncbi:hypothetical protein CC80DRAFT_147203 [Byssothecium circinans]|uniref:Uncharacterized protein n=1 Tax=Byssothecium circinans TaxID=147558 RepID=A0A6A5TWM9_9PLEO|nr:hypothetical protein CC80DRAFT_147203 [Byssothecium circinans]